MSSLGTQGTQGTPGLVPRHGAVTCILGWAGLVCPRGLVGMFRIPGPHPPRLKP